MAEEIERKFLLLNDDWRPQVQRREAMRQGYLHSDERCSVRVRIADDLATLNIKSATLGTCRQEYEYALPRADAEELLDTLCHRPLLEKTRHYLQIGPHCWEIDEFAGDNAGLIVAELELDHADETFDRPDWLGREVTDDPRYYNACLAQNPYCLWREASD